MLDASAALAPPKHSADGANGANGANGAAPNYQSIPSAPDQPGEVRDRHLSVGGPDESEGSSGRPAFAEHLGKHRQYWRDIILGVNDGLMSTFLLVAGVAGGGLSASDIFLTAVAGALAGAVSMYAGEFVATKSQNEVLTGEIALENHHVQNYRQDELRELSELLSLIGIPDDPGCGEGWDLRNRLVSYYESNGDALLKCMIALEFGVLEEELRSPCAAGLTSCGLFFLGSLPSVVPFAVVEDSMTGLIAAGVGTAATLFAVGAVKTWATRGAWLESAMENFVIAGVGGAFAYGVGVGFDRITKGE